MKKLKTYHGVLVLDLKRLDLVKNGSINIATPIKIFLSSSVGIMGSNFMIESGLQKPSATVIGAFASIISYYGVALLGKLAGVCIAIGPAARVDALTRELFEMGLFDEKPPLKYLVMHRHLTVEDPDRKYYEIVIPTPNGPIFIIQSDDNIAVRDFGEVSLSSQEEAIRKLIMTRKQ